MGGGWGFQLHCTPYWLGKMMFWSGAMDGKVLKKWVIPTRLEVTQAELPSSPSYPPSPKHQQTTCHNGFPSAPGMLWQHSHTEKVAHVTHSLQGCCPQKYHSQECARQLYQNIVWNILTRLRISGQINNLHICVENCYQFWLQVLHLVRTLGHLYWAPGCDLSLPHKSKIEHTSLKLKSALCLCVDAMCHECAVQLEYVITLATLCLLCNFQIKPFVLSQT